MESHQTPICQFEIYSVAKKKADSGQTNNVVINFKDSKVTVDQLKKQLLDWPNHGL